MINSTIEQKCLLTVLDAQGRKNYRAHVLLKNGRNLLRVNVANLKQGIHYLHLVPEKRQAGVHTFIKR
jgi:hypothetical protein